jgi:hypothetical protein
VTEDTAAETCLHLHVHVYTSLCGFTDLVFERIHLPSETSRGFAALAAVHAHCMCRCMYYSFALTEVPEAYAGTLSPSSKQLSAEVNAVLCGVIIMFRSVLFFSCVAACSSQLEGCHEMTDTPTSSEYQWPLYPVC